MNPRRRNLKPSRYPWPKGAVVDTHTASWRASVADKNRALLAMEKLNRPGVYNATLNLIARGESTVPAAVLAEAAEVERASKAFHAEQDEKWTEEAA